MLPSKPRPAAGARLQSEYPAARSRLVSIRALTIGGGATLGAVKLAGETLTVHGLLTVAAGSSASLAGD